MKKPLLFLLLSCFAFGQNIELLKSLQKGDENTPSLLAEKMLPAYKFVHTYTLDTREGDEVYFIYLPKNTTDEEVNEYKSGGGNGNELILSYLKRGPFYTFSIADGKCEVLIPFWKREIQPNVKVEKDFIDGYMYESPENKIKYRISPNDYTFDKCILNNKNKFKPAK